MRVVCLVALTSVLFAAEFWQSKPAAEWTPEEIARILTNSPWAQKAAVQTPGGAVGGGYGGAAGGSRRGRSVSTGGMSRSRGRVPDTSAGYAMSATIRWDSALPVRLALHKQDAPEDYVIAVMDFPLGRSESDTNEAETQRLEMLRENTSLIHKGKQSGPETVSWAPDGHTLLFNFSRGAGIVVDDKEVEFAMKMGSIQVRHKFHLKDMVYQGKLEL